MERVHNMLWLARIRESNRLVPHSHVSFESALYFHGLLKKAPRKMLAVGREAGEIKAFSKTFRYEQLRDCVYQEGIQTISVPNIGKIMVASKEKAIADILVRGIIKGSIPRSATEKMIESFLINKIGIDKKDLMELDSNELINLRIKYNKTQVKLLARLYAKTDGGRIWVADFPKTATQKDLQELFEQFGAVLSVLIRPGRNYCAFVVMKNPSEGKEAIRYLDRQMFQGCQIAVTETKEYVKKPRYIYALLSLEKNECYIGETCNPEKRPMAHLTPKGDPSSYPWISKLDRKLSTVILEAIEAGYDSEYQSIFLEIVWRLVAERCGWKVFNSPILLKPDDIYKAAVDSRMDRWPNIIQKDVL